MTDDGITLAAWFDAELANAPTTFGPMSRHLPTRDEALSIAAKHHAIGVICHDDTDTVFERVVCTGCGGSWWTEDAPDGEWFCTECCEVAS